MWLTRRNNKNNRTNAKSAWKQVSKLQKKWQFFGKIYVQGNFTHIYHKHSQSTPKSVEPDACPSKYVEIKCYQKLSKLAKQLTIVGNFYTYHWLEHPTRWMHPLNEEKVNFECSHFDIRPPPSSSLSYKCITALVFLKIKRFACIPQRHHWWHHVFEYLQFSSC